jgi:hypothetical protein
MKRLKQIFPKDSTTREDGFPEIRWKLLIITSSSSDAMSIWLHWKFGLESAPNFISKSLKKAKVKTEVEVTEKGKHIEPKSLENVGLVILDCAEEDARDTR